MDKQVSRPTRNGESKENLECNFGNQLSSANALCCEIEKDVSCQERLANVCHQLHKLAIPEAITLKESSFASEGDFAIVRSVNERVLECFVFVLCRSSNVAQFCDDTKTVEYVLEIAIQNIEKEMWTTSETLKLSHQIMDLLKTNLTSFNFSNYIRNIFSRVFHHLTKENWKEFPTETRKICYIVSVLLFPDLSNIAPMIVPVSLWLMDDFENEHKKLGVHIISCLFKSNNSSELLSTDYLAVIYDALLLQSYVHEPSVLEIVLPTLLLALDGMEPIEDHLAPSKLHDQALGRLLSDMLLENNFQLCRVYSEVLLLYVKSLKHRTILHLKILLTVFERYLQYQDAFLRKHCLETVHFVIRSCWVRVKVSLPHLLRMCLKLLFDLHLEKNSPEDVLQVLLGVIQLLAKLDYNCVSSMLQKLRDSDNEKIVTIIQQIQI